MEENLYKLKTLKFNDNNYFHICHHNKCPDESRHVQFMFNYDELPEYMNQEYYYNDTENYDLTVILVDKYPARMQEYICSVLNNNERINDYDYNLIKNFNTLSYEKQEECLNLLYNNKKLYNNFEF